MTKPLHITDHAVKRFHERLGCTSPDPRAEIAKPLVAAYEAVRKAGWAGEIILRHGGYAFIIERHSLVTVLNPSQRPKAKSTKKALVLDVVAK